jgi:hypothetical protein
MANLDTFPGIDECIFCFGKVRVARPAEIEKRLLSASPAFRAAVENHPGTWYICPRCGPESAVKWQSVSVD